MNVSFKVGRCTLHTAQLLQTVEVETTTVVEKEVCHNVTLRQHSLYVGIYCRDRGRARRMTAIVW